MATPKSKQEAVLEIPLERLQEDPNNPRTSLDGEALGELALSIKQNGVIEPLIVRTWAASPVETPAGTDYEPTYRIVAGHRRFMAAKIAGLAAVPCIARTLTDTQAEDVQIHENLHRADLEPLDEADMFARLREKGESIEQIAQRAGKGTTYVAKRLKFADVLPELRADCKAGTVPLSFVFEFAKYPEDIQTLIYANLYDTQNILVHPDNPELFWDEDAGVYSDFDYKDENDEFESDEEVEEYEAKLEAYQKELPEPVEKEGARRLRVEHATAITRMVNEQLSNRLDRMPWSIEATDLRADGLACVQCPNRTGINAGLFGNEDEPDCCLDPKCYHGKLVKHIQITRKEVAKAQKVKVSEVKIQAAQWSDERKEWPKDFDFVTRGDYRDHEIRGEDDGCDKMTVMVRTDGKIGGVCYHETGCTKHKYNNGYSSSSSSSPREKGVEKTPAEKKKFNDRKEELFDVKVGEATRVEVVAQAAEYFAKNGLGALSDVTDWMTLRLWEQVNYTDNNSFGIFCTAAKLKLPSVDGYSNKNRYPEAFAKLTQEQKAKLLIVLSHYWKGDMWNKRYEPQAGVREVAKYFDINYALIDAQKRLEFSPKKHEKKFQAYVQQCEVNDPAASLPRIYSEGYIAPEFRPKTAAEVAEEAERDDWQDCDECEEYIDNVDEGVGYTPEQMFSYHANGHSEEVTVEEPTNAERLVEVAKVSNGRIIVGRPAAMVEEPETAATVRMVECGQCGHSGEVRRGRKTCPKCGASTANVRFFDEVPEVEELEPETPETGVCVSCGDAIFEGLTVCGACEDGDGVEDKEFADDDITDLLDDLEAEFDKEVAA